MLFQWPSVSFEEMKQKWRGYPEISRIDGPYDQSKFAMIFGARSVYTFDGKLYESAEYTANCTFLLAHDLRQAKFSVMSDKTSILILFPEMSVRVNDKDEVFVNGTKISSLPLVSHNG